MSIMLIMFLAVGMEWWPVERSWRMRSPGNAGSPASILYFLKFYRFDSHNFKNIWDPFHFIHMSSTVLVSIMFLPVMEVTFVFQTGEREFLPRWIILYIHRLRGSSFVIFLVLQSDSDTVPLECFSPRSWLQSQLHNRRWVPLNILRNP